MDAKYIALVQHSFESIRPIAHIVAGLFYGRLFTLDPSIRSLFPADMRGQEQKFADMLGFIVDELHHPDVVSLELQALGRRHARYGVRGQHYVTAGVALLTALRESLGEHCTPEVEVAWASAYAMLADTMQDAAMGNG